MREHLITDLPQSGTELVNGSKNKWKVGDMARYVTLSCARELIVEVPVKEGGGYCCMNDGGTINYHSEWELLTLEEWLEWFENFRDELTGKEYREYGENARKEFEPPPWWNEAVRTAMDGITEYCLPCWAGYHLQQDDKLRADGGDSHTGEMSHSGPSTGALPHNEVGGKA